MKRSWFWAVGLVVIACSSRAVVDDGAGAGGTSSSATQASSGTTTTTSTSSGTSFGACDGPGQCILGFPGCCGPRCQLPELADVEPIHRSSEQALFDATCPDPEGTGCPDCAGPPNGALFAYCDGAACQEADVRVHPFSECSDASECILRWGTGCCEMCGGYYAPGIEGGDLVAMRADAVDDLTGLVCEPNAGACPPCVPIYPDGVLADCIDGRCRVVAVGP